MHRSWHTAVRFARNGMEPLLVLVAVAGLRLFGLSGDGPLWIIAALLLASMVYRQLRVLTTARVVARTPRPDEVAETAPAETGVAETTPDTAPEQVAHTAAYDSLTGLANGPMLIRDLELALRQGTRYQHPVGMLFLDLDGIKPVNDAYGPEVGDRLLRTISEVIAHNTRDTDVVGRLGGDEFGVVLTRVHGADEARTVAARVIAGIVNNSSVAGLRLDVGCSIGVSLAYPGGTDAKTLLRHADTAMDKAKRRGRNGCELFVEEELNAPWL
jgi:diguanylate cyclase (GGDEF)-like protein